MCNRFECPVLKCVKITCSLLLKLWIILPRFMFFVPYNNADLYDMSPKLSAISYYTLLKLNVFLLLY